MNVFQLCYQRLDTVAKSMASEMIWDTQDQARKILIIQIRNSKSSNAPETNSNIPSRRPMSWPNYTMQHNEYQSCQNFIQQAKSSFDKSICEK